MWKDPTPLGRHIEIISPRPLVAPARHRVRAIKTTPDARKGKTPARGGRHGPETGALHILHQPSKHHRVTCKALDFAGAEAAPAVRVVRSGIAFDYLHQLRENY